RQEDPEAGRRGQRGRREAQGEGADQPLPQVVRGVARELHALLEGRVVRLRRGARQDHRERTEVQRRSRESAGRRQERRRPTGRRIGPEAPYLVMETFSLNVMVPTCVNEPAGTTLYVSALVPE